MKQIKKSLKRQDESVLSEGYDPAHPFICEKAFILEEATLATIRKNERKWKTKKTSHVALRA